MDIDLLDPRADRVSLLTIHASKGLEFPIVFMTGCEDGILPLRWGDDLDEAEERRLFFVGMTRAKTQLYLSHAQKRLWRGRLSEQTISPFLQDIRNELLHKHKTKWAKPRPETTTIQLELF